MSMTKTHIRDMMTIEWSEVASVRHQSGEWWSPFMHDSLTARVEYADGYVVIVTLPPGSRRDFTQLKGAYASAVALAADRAKSRGDNLAEVP